MNTSTSTVHITLFHIVELCSPVSTELGETALHSSGSVQPEEHPTEEHF